MKYLAASTSSAFYVSVHDDLSYSCGEMSD